VDDEHRPTASDGENGPNNLEESPAAAGASADPASSPPSDRRRLLTIAGIGLLSGLAGGLAVTILDPGRLPIALVLLVGVGGLVTLLLLRVARRYW